MLVLAELIWTLTRFALALELIVSIVAMARQNLMDERTICLLHGCSAKR